MHVTDAEILMCYTVAGCRQLKGMHGRNSGRYVDKHGQPKDAGAEVRGAIGEYAVSKMMGEWWCDPTAVGMPDVGGWIDVRTIQKPHHKLIIHDEDDGRRPFVLADISKLPEVAIHGWRYAYECKQLTWWSDPSRENRPAYFVPRKFLRPMSDLIEIKYDGLLQRQRPEDRGVAQGVDHRR